MVAIAERVTFKGHREQASYRRELGRCLLELGRYEQAERELLRGVLDLEQSSDPRAEEIRPVLLDLIELYEAQARSENAERTRAKLGRLDASTAGHSLNSP